MTDLRTTVEKQYEQSVFLCISSFRGISFGAVHYYGKLRVSCGCSVIPCGHKKDEELKRTLSASAARELTKLHNDNSFFGGSYTYDEGDEVTSFDTKDDVIAAAKKVWKEAFPEKTLLVLGEPSVWKVYPVLDKR